MFNQKLTESEKYQMVDSKKEIKNHSYYHFEFDNLGNYNDTAVSISIKLPFRKLHLLYLIPYQILKSYWSIVSRRTDIDFVESNFQYCINHEKEHLQKLDEFLPLSKIDMNKEFPHLFKDSE